jgi:hypothetical protein
MQLIEGSKGQDAAPEAMPVQADSDGNLIALWLFGKADRTRRAYQDDLAAFLRIADKSLRQVTLADLVIWGETLSGSCRRAFDEERFDRRGDGGRASGRTHEGASNRTG